MPLRRGPLHQTSLFRRLALCQRLRPAIFSGGFLSFLALEKTSPNPTLHLHARAESGRKGRRGEKREAAFPPRLPKNTARCVSLHERHWAVNTLDRDRTCNLQLRRLTLYPIELRGRIDETDSTRRSPAATGGDGGAAAWRRSPGFRPGRRERKEAPHGNAGIEGG
jgi:hypothetical protein